MRLSSEYTNGDEKQLEVGLAEFSTSAGPEILREIATITAVRGCHSFDSKEIERLFRVYCLEPVFGELRNWHNKAFALLDDKGWGLLQKYLRYHDEVVKSEGG